MEVTKETKQSVEPRTRNRNGGGLLLTAEADVLKHDDREEVIGNRTRTLMAQSSEHVCHAQNTHNVDNKDS